MLANKVFGNLYYIIAGAWRQRYVIMIPMLIMPLVAALVAAVMPLKYEAHTTILIQETAKMNPFLEDLAVSSNLKERMAALKALLHSHHMLESVARKMGYLGKDASGAEVDEQVGRISRALNVNFIGSDLIRIEYSSRDPSVVAPILADVSEHFIAQLLAPERSSISSSERFLKDQLELRRQDLIQAEEALADYRTHNASELPEFHASNVARLNELQQQLAEREVALAGAKNELKSLDSRLLQTNPVIGVIERKLVELEGLLAVYRASYTDQHSKVQGALRQIERLQEERAHLLAQTQSHSDSDRLWQLANSAQSPSADPSASVKPLLITQLEQVQLAQAKVDGLEEEVRSLKDLVIALTQAVADFGANERTMKELSRDLRVNTKLYEDLLSRYEMARITGSLGRFEENDRVKVIDAPRTPHRPVNPPMLVFVIAGFVGGILFGTGIAVIVEWSDTSVRRSEVLEQITGVPVLARIPRLGPAVYERFQQGAQAISPID